MDHRLILVTVLIRLGVAAAISSVLVRARRFRVLLFREERTLGEKIEIVFIVGTPIALGVLVRHWVHNFYAADISFEGAILMGVIGGRLVGIAGGALVALPAVVFGEWLTLPMYVLAGALAGRAAPSGTRSRSHLVVLAALRSQHLSLDSTQHPQVLHRLADLVLLPHSGPGVRPHTTASLPSRGASSRSTRITGRSTWPSTPARSWQSPSP